MKTEKSAQKEKEIIETYKELKNLNETWKRFMVFGYSRAEVDVIISEAGIKRPRGGSRWKEELLVENPAAKPFTDETLNFEEEIKTIIYK